jgi:serine/threonine-protein kinase
MTHPAPQEGFPAQYGKYQLLARIGHGGMAEVFRARLPGVAGFEKIVVIKRLLPHLAHDPSMVEMFVHEAKLAAEVQHRNVVNVFELAQTESGEFYMAMEHVAGTDLRQILRAAAVNSMRVPPWFSVHSIAEILDGLAYAHDLRDHHGHRRNVVHRDVTPANIFISHMGDIKLGDFGVARDDMRSSLTRAGQLKGKVPYMSPEQLYGRDLDQRTDVFAVGVVLWECLTQRRLFGGRPDIEAMNLICYGERKPPSLFSNDVPSELDAVVLRALMSDPDQRTGSARQLRDELHALLPRLRPNVQQKDVRNIVESLLGNRDPSANTGPRSIQDESVVKQNFFEPTPYGLTPSKPIDVPVVLKSPWEPQASQGQRSRSQEMPVDPYAQQVYAQPLYPSQPTQDIRAQQAPYPKAQLPPDLREQGYTPSKPPQARSESYEAPYPRWPSAPVPPPAPAPRAAPPARNPRPFTHSQVMPQTERVQFPPPLVAPDLGPSRSSSDLPRHTAPAPPPPPSTSSPGTYELLAPQVTEVPIIPVRPPASSAPPEPRQDERRVTDDLAARAVVSLMSPAAIRQEESEAQTEAGSNPWSEHVLYDAPYQGPQPFWVRAKEGVAGPLRLEDAMNIMRFECEADRSDELRISGNDKSWLDAASFAMLTGQEILLDRFAKSEKPLPIRTSIAGSFQHVSITGLFGRIARECPSGRLIVAQQHGVRREILFAQGRPTFVYANVEDLQLPELLVHKNIVGKDQIEEMVHAAVIEDRALEDVIQDRTGYDVSRYWTAFMKERLTELFRWKQARFAFDVDAPLTHSVPFAQSLLGLLPELVYRTQSADELNDALSPYMNFKLERSERLAKGLSEMRLNEQQKQVVAALGAGKTLSWALKHAGKEEKVNLTIAYVLIETDLFLRPI